MVQNRWKMQIFGLLIGILGLNGCHLFKETPSQARNAYCRQMKGEMLLNNGVDLNPNRAFTERSERPGMAKDYHNKCMS